MLCRKTFSSRSAIRGALALVTTCNHSAVSSSLTLSSNFLKKRPLVDGYEGAIRSGLLRVTGCRDDDPRGRQHLDHFASHVSQSICRGQPSSTPFPAETRTRGAHFRGMDDPGGPEEHRPLPSSRAAKSRGVRGVAGSGDEQSPGAGHYRQPGRPIPSRHLRRACRSLTSRTTAQSQGGYTSKPRPALAITPSTRGRMVHSYKPKKPAQRNQVSQLVIPRRLLGRGARAPLSSERYAEHKRRTTARPPARTSRGSSPNKAQRPRAPITSGPEARATNTPCHEHQHQCPGTPDIATSKHRTSPQIRAHTLTRQPVTPAQHATRPLWSRPLPPGRRRGQGGCCACIPASERGGGCMRIWAGDLRNQDYIAGYGCG